ncbi:uncharacterized protein N0V89_008781 [Didymosphaeria variabile]|uniref:FAS1 domain-containing protein n=1 Tax=Didymosphaeria variabile TaxID=1932322 RepID=A0A9W8XGK5_9PLEO|nr:uncharacterized protein N0V89_008781 [Didymosphaeria variabile]KAJ4350160.1 hypothetical protein N0V89_008781 [Didymosphaeria variabile]
MQFRDLAILALASLVATQDSDTDTQSLNATLSGNDQLSNLTSFLSLNPAIVSTLSQASNITILAPSNDAFSEFAETDVGRDIASNPGLLAALLQYHVLNGTFQASQITNQSTFVPTFLNNDTYANVTGGQVVEAVKVGNETVFYSGLLQNATVTTAYAMSGYKAGVHAGRLSKTPGLTPLSLKSLDISKWLEHLLHQPTSLGYEHYADSVPPPLVIDRVLVFPPNVLDTANALNLTSLRGAVNATDSIEAANARNITIFAPNNEAFNNIGSALANLSNDDLQNILEYHIVEDVYYSTSLENGTTLQTEDDDRELTITTNENGTVFVNAAEVVVPNVLIANGVLHIIDNVLNPDNTAVPSESATAGAPGFTGSAVSEQPFTSGQPTPTTQVNPTSEGAGPAQSTAAGSGSETSGAAMPLMTSGVQYAALFGAGAAAYLGF